MVLDNILFLTRFSITQKDLLIFCFGAGEMVFDILNYLPVKRPASTKVLSKIVSITKDTHSTPPLTLCYNSVDSGLSFSLKFVSNFLNARRQGLSPETIRFYRIYLSKASAVINLSVADQDITSFLSTLQCSSGGKHSYFRALRAFCNWLYSPKSSFRLNPLNNPILRWMLPRRKSEYAKH